MRLCLHVVRDGIITDYNTIPHAVMSSGRTDGNITEYNTIPHVAMSSVVRMVAAAQTIPHAVMSSGRTDGIITDYNTVMYAVGWWLVPDGWLSCHVVRMESQHHFPCGWCQLRKPSPMRLALLAGSCQSCGWNHNTIPHAVGGDHVDGWLCGHVFRSYGMGL